MTDLDGLLAEVEIRTDRSHHWTGQSKLTISDADLAKKLAAAVRVLRDRPCPHIETGDDGTSHCTLAEAANTAWATRWQEQHDRAERAETLRDGIREILNEWDYRWAANVTLSAAHDARDSLRTLLAVADRPGGTDNPTSDKTCTTCNDTGVVAQSPGCDADGFYPCPDCDYGCLPWR